MMPLVEHWIGTKHPFQSLSSLLSSSAGLKSLKLHPPDILAIRIPYVTKILPSEVPCYGCRWREGIRQRLSAAGFVISSVIEELNFPVALLTEVTVTAAFWAPRGRMQDIVFTS